jgi:hypothetical protein
MFGGPASKAWASWIAGFTTILTMVSTANIVHGKYVIWIAIGIAALGMLAAIPRAVWKVPNTSANLVTDASSVVNTVVPEVRSFAGQVQADLHGGAAQAAPWPTTTPPTLQEPTSVS